MAKYLFSYSGGMMAESDEERETLMAKWGAWFGDWPAILDGGNPISTSTVVSSAGTSEGGKITGYSLIEADSLDAAAKLAEGCPVLEGGGSVEVGETIPM